MGCGGSEEKQGEAKVEVVEDQPEESAAKASPLFLSISNKWKEGKEKEEVVGVLKATQAAAMGCPGVLGFQYGVNEETKTNVLTECYADAAAVAAFTKASAEGVKTLLDTIETTSLRFYGPKDQVDAVKDGLSSFAGFEYFYTDAVGPAFDPEGTGDHAPLILSISNKWKEGKTKDEVVGVLKATQEAAMATPGVFAFQYGVNEETKTNTLTEIYKDAAAMGAFSAAGAEGVKTLLDTIETTSLRLYGPKDQVDAVKDGLSAFAGFEYFYTDDVGSAMMKFK